VPYYDRCAKHLVTEARHGVFINFGQVKNYLLIEGTLKKVVAKVEKHQRDNNKP